MERQDLTPEQRRKVLADRLPRHSEDEPTRHAVHFSNDDVPTFLAALQAYREQSRRVRLTVK